MSRLAGMFFCLVIVISTSPYGLVAQSVSGKVVGANDGKAVAFAHVTDSMGRLVAVCDLEGKFLVSDQHKKLSFSSVGYQKQMIHLDTYNIPLLIRLEPSVEELAEVVVAAGENPALRIIRNTRENLNSNAPTALPAYKLTRYDRLVIGADSGNRLPLPELAEHLKEYDLLVMETVVDEFFTSSSGKSFEIKASRVSGLKDPIFVFLMDQMHSLDFYSDRISVGGSWYVSPLAAGSLNRYRFVLEESIAVSETDSLFTIRFAPLPESRFDGLKGKISIQSPDWAIRTVVASPAVENGNIQAEIRQLYEKIDGLAWFPIVLNTRLWLSVPTVSGKVLLAGEGKSRILQIVINPENPPKDSRRYALTINQHAWQSDEQLWRDLRPDELNPRLQQTYRFMDSIGQVYNIGRRLAFATALTEGHFRFGGFNLPIKSLLRFNHTEGYRPGLEVITNDRYSSVWSLGLYGGYATRVRKPLWKIEARYDAKRWQGACALISFYDLHKTREPGLYDEEMGLLNPYAFRQLFYSGQTNRQGYKATLIIPLGRHISLRPAFTREIISTLKPLNQTTHDEKLISEITLGLRLAPGERFMRSEHSVVRLSAPNPLLMAEIQRLTIGRRSNQTISALRVRISFDYSFNHPFAGTTLMRLETGFTDKPVPALLDFQLPGSHNPYFLFAPFSFGTLEPGAVQTPGLISLYLQHKMLPLRPVGRKFRPQPVLIHNMAVRALPFKHTNINGNEAFLSQPLLESGLLITNLIKSGRGNLGAGLMFRWNRKTSFDLSNQLFFKLAFSINSAVS